MGMHSGRHDVRAARVASRPGYVRSLIHRSPQLTNVSVQRCYGICKHVALGLS